ncbi:aqualysin-1-like [Diadema setosum]|uniref:aqualysin-1-like n=1 Tax=Diadema setosum TaxID=31175 RepID=UPI003B3B255B
MKIFVYFFALLATSYAYNATLDTTAEAIKHHYIVVLNPEYDLQVFENTIVGDKSGIFQEAVITWRYTVINGLSIKLLPHALEKVRVMKAVKYVAEDGIARTFAQASWGLDRVDQRNLPLDGEANFEGNGDGVNVYVVDTGIYPESKYFAGRASVAFDAIGNRDAYGIDCNGHGTHCAGTVGSDVYGVARGAKIYGVRVLNCYGSGSYSQVIAGVDFVANQGVRPAVASMSIGGPPSRAVDDAVRGLINSGVTAVVAAGNWDMDACYTSPSRVSEAITVGATDINDKRASFSNTGSCVDIFAPGVSIPSAWIGGEEETRTISGTSMACPHVTGAAAIMLGNDNSLTPVDIKNKLLYDSTKQVVEDPGRESPNRMLYIP